MHILHYNLTTTTKYGGVETLVWEVAREQAARGHRVTIVGGAGKIREAIPGARVLQSPYIDRDVFRRVPGLGRQYALTKLFERASMAPAALPLLPRCGGVAHLHKPYDLIMAPLLRRLGYQIVLHHHGEDFFIGDRLLIRYADVQLSCSAWNGQRVERRYKVAPTVVYNGVDVEHFRPGAPDRELRALLAGPDEQLLLFVGRLIPWKGVQDLIAALCHLSPSARLLVAGSGPYEPTLRAHAHELGVEGRVSWLGAIPNRELPRYYATADLAVGASFASETFGMTLCEAMSCERAVVATRFGGFPEVVQAGETGLLVEPRSAEELARAIAALLADPARRARMGAAGRRRVLEHFSWGAVTERIMSAYGAGRLDRTS